MGQIESKTFWNFQLLLQNIEDAAMHESHNMVWSGD